MEYVGELTWAGNLGRLAVVASFVFALLSAAAFFIALLNQKKNAPHEHWTALGKIAFRGHTLSVLAIVAVLFYLIFNHRFEFDYVWKHSSLDLPLRYIFSCFWEGQEGSFLLWMIWHAVLGAILLHTAKNWIAPVMLIFGLVQAFLASMILGVYVGDVMIGSSPFVLIRDLAENIGAPWTTWPDYLTRLPAFADGNGLNPLLQNYWMTIHPPTLFLGFASTLVPFAYALGGLIKGDYKGWIAPALPWTFFSVMILGTGILMGGAWAYEALSFGGFWAWDPVENASLVPWLTLVAGAHLMLVQKNKGGVLQSTFFFMLIIFLLILYSTYLTRSGVLGATSVHSFVDLGLNAQLKAYLFFFIALAFGIFFWRYKSIPKVKKEENLDSRAFWMFVGALVLLVSAFQIIFSTSMPVLNLFFGPEGYLPMFKEELAAPDDAIGHYNSFQMPFAIIIALLMGITQYLNYRGEGLKKHQKDIYITLGTSLVISLIIGFASGYEHVYFLMLFSSIYVIVANLFYWIRVARGNWNIAGSSVAHIGFGMILLGALISNYKKNVISTNDTFIAKDFPQNENLLLELGDTVKMDEYYVTWVGERQEGNHRIYDMDYFRYNENNQTLSKAFRLSPSILKTDNAGNNPEPSTRHFLHKDIYTHLTYADLRTEDEKKSGFTSESEIELAQGDTLIYAKRFVIMDTLIVEGDLSNPHLDFLGLTAKITVLEMDGGRYEAKPQYVIRNNELEVVPDEIEQIGLKITFEGVNTEAGKMKLKLQQREVADETPFVVITAIIFPWINILWAGSLLLIVGTVLAIFQRIRANRLKA